MTNNYVKAVEFHKRVIKQQTIAFFDASSQESIERAKDRIGEAPGELSIFRAMPIAFPGVPEIGEVEPAS